MYAPITQRTLCHKEKLEIMRYHCCCRALFILDEQCGKGYSPEDIQMLTEERIKCHNNLGAAQLKVVLKLLIIYGNNQQTVTHVI